MQKAIFHSFFSQMLHYLYVYLKILETINIKKHEINSMQLNDYMITCCKKLFSKFRKRVHCLIDSLHTIKLYITLLYF